MELAVGIIISLILIWGMIASPRFRWTILSIAIVIALSIWWISERKKEERALARQRIKKIELSNIVLDHDFGTSFRFKGKVKNPSTNYTLNRFGVKANVFDCPKKNSTTQKCLTIGEDTGIVYVTVPPGQVRQFKENLYFSNLPKVEGEFVWSYKITWIEAK